MRNLSIMTLFFLSFTCAPGMSQAQIKYESRPSSEKSYQQVMMTIDSLIKKYQIPGVSFALVSKDSILHVNSLGWADIDSRVAVTKTTMFRVGSVTKSFVALGILKLAEENKLDLHSPVRDILPELDIDNPWEKTDPVRVVHLLEHTAGFNDSHFNDYYLDGDPFMPLLQGIKVSKHSLKVRWKPGYWYSYSSVGYMVVGCVIEKISGMTFEEYLKIAVLEPIGMTFTNFHVTPDIKKSLAQGYQDHYQTSPFWYSYSRPAGSMITSALEMSRFLQFMLNRGRIGDTQILPEAFIDRMQSTETHPAMRVGLDAGARFGIGMSYYKGFKWFSHYGSIMGFAAAYTYCPELGKGCVLLTNRWDVDFETGMMKVWNTIRDELVQDFPVPQDYPLPYTVSSDILKSYTGYFKFQNPPQKLGAWIDLLLNYQRVSLFRDTLVCKEFLFGEREKLIPVTQQTFRHEAENHASVAFFKTADNQLALIDGNSAYLHTSFWKPWIHIFSFILAWILMLSSIFYAVVWIPLELYRRLLKKNFRHGYLRIRIVPLSAVLLILLAFTLVGIQASQSLTALGQKNFTNIFFYLSSWLFALLSFLSFYFAIRGLKQPINRVEKTYAVLLSLSCVGMTLYWGYWDIIGLKWWAY